MNERAEKLIKMTASDEAYLITSPENIFAISGFLGEGALLAESEKIYIITDFRYIEAAEKIDGFVVCDIKGGIENIVEKRIKRIYIEENNLSVSQFRNYQKKLSWVTLEDGSEIIDSLRIIKSESEIKKISTAAQIATYSFKKCIEKMAAGVSEREIALLFEETVRRQGASGLAFDTIVASGENSSMPHAGVSGRTFKSGDFVTMDFGCVYEGYCSDMTRTVAIGSASDEQREIYNIVKKAQEAAEKEYIAGRKCADADKTARSIISEAGYGDNFGHSLGHGVGTVIHEKPYISPKSDSVFENKIVVSCEPGIYIAGKFGVRIEDLLIIDGENAHNLSNFQKDLLIL